MIKKALKNMTFIRVLTSLVGLPLLFVFIILGGWPLKAVLAMLAGLGMNELYRALSDKHKPIHFVGYAFAAIYYVLLDNLYNTNVFTVIMISFTLALCVTTVAFHRTISVRDAAATFFGFFYVAVLLSTVYLASITKHGDLLIWIVFISAWGCDTGAYFIGRMIGKRKLAPQLSPNKTVAGAVGGTLVSALLTAALGFFIFKTKPADINLLIFKFTIIGAVCAVFSQAGDLFASTIKRYTGIKDFGRILPGHGGVIDRFDSVFFTAPALYIAVLLFIK